MRYDEYEDGYNLAMLEAMASGMPVVALANRSSPITDGVDGFFALNAEAGADTIDASASSLPLVLFGGDGADTLRGGSSRDIIVGDRGRVDYRDDMDTLITRLGIGLLIQRMLRINSAIKHVGNPVCLDEYRDQEIAVLMIQCVVKHVLLFL